MDATSNITTGDGTSSQAMIAWTQRIAKVFDFSLMICHFLLYPIISTVIFFTYIAMEENV